MKPLNLSARELLEISAQCIVVLVVLCALMAVAGCSTTKQKDPEVIFKTINRPVAAVPDIPEHLLRDYDGQYPMATPGGEVCFAGDEIRNLQELLQFLNNQNRSLKELLR